MRFSLLRPLGTLTLVFCVCAAGCGPKTVKVSGRILKDGQPTTFTKKTYVTLKFIPDDGKGDTVGAKIDNEAGTYEVDLTPGRYRVSLFVPPENFQAGDRRLLPPPTGGAGGDEVYDLTTSKTLDLPVPSGKPPRK